MTALSADQEAYIAARVAAGDFERPEDVVFLAFQLLKERDRDAARLHHLRADLDLANRQIDDGQPVLARATTSSPRSLDRFQHRHFPFPPRSPSHFHF